MDPKVITHTEEHMGRTLFIVSRHDRDLYAYLGERFASDSAVEVILDRRVVQRRQRYEPQAGECRRRGDRRRRPEVEAELQMRSHAILTIPDLVMD
jgi:hypothetical protein